MKQISKNIKTAVVFALLSTVFFSCKKSFLEVTPKGKLIAQKVSDYNLLLNNLDLVNQISSNAQITLGDEMAAIEPYYSGKDLRTQRLFRWDDVVYEPNEDAGELSAPLKNIYTYNKIITELPNATDGTELQKSSIKAEAMAGRAWTYFLLINYFGKPYNATTSSSDPGFPIVTAPDVTQTKFTRASVKEVYDFIINDLVSAIPNLPQKVSSRIRMSRPAAEGILGKVYVYMGKFSDAIPHLNASIQGLANASIPVGLYDYNVTFAPGGQFTPIDDFGVPYPNLDGIQENIYGKQCYNDGPFGNALVLDKKTVDLYQSSDLRLNFYSSNAVFGPEYPQGFLRRTSPGTIQFGVVIPDLYLLSAECKARTNDLSGAKTDLEYLRIRRLPSDSYEVPASVANQQLPLLKYILDERIREFSAMGYRWFDIRRLSVDPLFSSNVYTHTLYSATGTVSKTFTLKPNRFTLRFPQKVINENPGMENNP
ncbi:RagB/SusD family nutrient uptake outer membrane protein [Pedobacter sp. KBS0701]|uniref:RagB/SusD family nutrient uptake outer membrane protein n=1 Tax=Pedobacter sp. KBS0701 TaxID=2578106 RepID=UPI00110DA1D8|nr:RagB/SusD family nutrient uptake outer membrane protein [Pedobacter sp. KBS0701]QDW23972.1 RagB/SusD family nutrient uptake outer membrane protein [Pedobacter sp. KBS0701]